MKSLKEWIDKYEKERNDPCELSVMLPQLVGSPIAEKYTRSEPLSVIMSLERRWNTMSHDGLDMTVFSVRKS